MILLRKPARSARLEADDMRAKRGGACINPGAHHFQGPEALSHAKINCDNRFYARGSVNLHCRRMPVMHLIHTRCIKYIAGSHHLPALEPTLEIVIVLEECINYLFMKIFCRRSA